MNKLLSGFMKKVKGKRKLLSKTQSSVESGIKAKKKKIQEKRKIRIDMLKFLSNFNFKKSIMGKISTSFVLIVLLTLLSVGIITTIVSTSEVVKDFKSSTDQILKQNKNYIEYIVSTIDNYSMQLFSNVTVKNGVFNEFLDGTEEYNARDAAVKTLYTMTSTSSDSTISSIYIINPKDKKAVGSPDIPPSDIDFEKLVQSDYHKKAVELKGKSLWLPNYTVDFAKDTNKSTTKYISNVRLFRDSTNTGLTGILMINMKPEVFQNALANVKIGNKGYMFIVDAEGNIISHPDSNLLGVNVKDKDQIKKTLSDEEGSFTYYDTDHKDKMFAVYTSSKKTGWRYIAVVPEAELSGTARNIMVYLIIICLICFAITVFVSMRISLVIARPIMELLSAMGKVEKGDLTVEVGHVSEDELGILSGSFNKMVYNVRQLVSSVKEAVQQTNNASRLITSSTEELAVSTTDVSRVIDEIASGAGNQAQQASKGVEIVDSFGKEVVSVVNYSNDASGSASDARNKANAGMDSVTQLKDKSVQNIEILGKVSESINELSENTNEIEGILKSIASISQQTNLLSLNAAIEAARAGEAGRGFAVVAGEVRKLADESKKAAESISSIIKNVNNRTKDTVEASKLIINALNDEVKHVDETLEAFQSIKGSVETVGNKIEQLNTTIGSIDKEKNLIISSIEEIAAISEETAASTQEVSASAQQQSASVQEMNSMANGLYEISTRLKELTDKFNI